MSNSGCKQLELLTNHKLPRVLLILKASELMPKL